MILCISPSPDNKKIYTFETFRPGGVNRALSVEPWLSGKCVNAARAAAAMGERVMLAGLMGGDLRSTATGILEHAQIESRLVFSHGHTRSCITVVEKATGTATELIEEPPPVDPLDAAALMALFREILENESISAVIASGSLPEGCPSDMYRRIAEQCAERDIPLVLDAAGSPLREAIAARPAVVKLNAYEFTGVFPLHGCERLPDVVPRVSAETGGLAIVTVAAGNVAYSRAGGACGSVAPPHIQPVNPIGSGDAFAAGVAIALARGYDDLHLVQLGVAMGTANALTLRPGELRREDVEKLMEEIGGGKDDCYGG